MNKKPNIDYPIWFGNVKVYYDNEDDLIATLPHQCDEWHIGAIPNLEDLIMHLEAALIYMEKTKFKELKENE